MSASVTFGNLTVSASQSTVVTTTPIVATTTSGVSATVGTVDVTLLDGTSPVSGKTVTLTDRLPVQHRDDHAQFPGSDTTGSDGVATFTGE